MILGNGNHRSSLMRFSVCVCVWVCVEMPCAKQKEVLVLLLLSMLLLFLLLVSLFSHIVLVAVVISGELLTEAKIIKPF